MLFPVNVCQLETDTPDSVKSKACIHVCNAAIINQISIGKESLSVLWAPITEPESLKWLKINGQMIIDPIQRSTQKQPLIGDVTGQSTITQPHVSTTASATARHRTLPNE